jgi:putative ABC transport system permease protein
MLLASYFMGLDEMIFGSQFFYIALAMGVVGTFLFFFSLSGFFLKLFRQSRRIYLKGLNMFVLRQINSKINTTYVSVSMVCLMLFISIVTLSSGIGISNRISESMENNIPFDASLVATAAVDGRDVTVNNYPGFDLIRIAEEKGIRLDDFAESYWTTRFYGVDGQTERAVAKELMNIGPRFMKLSDFNLILERRGIAPITLKPGECALNSSDSNSEYRKKLNAFAESAPSITVGGTRLTADASRLYRYALNVTQNPGMAVTVVVPDELLAGARPVADVLQIIYKGDDKGYEAQCREALAQLSLPGNVLKSLETGASVRETSNTATTTVAYLAIYLGVVFLITSAAVLAISQLSETSDNVHRYGLLRKIGTDDRMIHKALFAQILIYFGVPLLLALAHSAVGIGIMNKLVHMLGNGSILGSSLFMAAIMLVIYGGYFLATYFSSKNMIARSNLQNS